MDTWKLTGICGRTLCYHSVLGCRASASRVIDLHCHSDCSDGALSPGALVQRAATRGLRVLALTDHDTVAGLAEAERTARQAGIAFVNGVEISVSWGATTLHVLGLRIDPEAPHLVEGLSVLRAARSRRGEEIASKLERVGFHGALQGALQLASAPDRLGRVHFARWLVAQEAVKDVKSAFRRYLGEGRPAHVRHRWTSLVHAIEWIRGAGGVALLAHPARSGLRPGRLGALFAEFQALGGVGVEVVSGCHTRQDAEAIAELARATGLLASSGSDFHSPEDSWLDVGQVACLPPRCVPVWRDWPECGGVGPH
jgi:predicted metal-dependent phosphoesterase TrpH